VEEVAVDGADAEEPPEDEFVDLEDVISDPHCPDTPKQRRRVLDERQRVLQFMREPTVRIVLPMEELPNQIAERYVYHQPVVHREETECVRRENPRRVSQRSLIRKIRRRTRAIEIRRKLLLFWRRRLLVRLLQGSAVVPCLSYVGHSVL
jgi:hypothetical protein